MFEGAAAEVLSSILGDYVEGVSKERLSVAVWSGTVSLENLVVRRDALDHLELPVEVRGGWIGSLELDVPWAHLGTAPVIVRVDRVHIVLAPVRPGDAREEAERAVRVKLRRLEAAELMKAASRADDG
jgi:vacuolar protein sorting-associated protein 13A/C